MSSSQDKDRSWASRRCLQNGGLGSDPELLVHGGVRPQVGASPGGGSGRRAPVAPDLREAQA